MMNETTTAGAVPAFADPEFARDAHPVRVAAGHPRYPDLVRGKNQRWVGAPEYVCLATNAEQVRAAVQDAVDAGKRISVRSGGHCYEDFVYNPEIEVVIDLSEMTRVYHDAKERAFAIEPGAELLDVYETLYRRWGVVIPGGMCFSVGAGGHICGGGYGLLSRKHGLVVDHLYAVEVVVVDEDRHARIVTATRDEQDPNHDLWWAHTGGGGGNFGIVTRYLLRSPDAGRKEPSRQLPAPPGEVLVSAVSWEWDLISESSFHRLVDNFAAWHVRNQDPDSPYAGLFSNLQLNHRSNGQIGLLTQMDASLPGAEKLLERFVRAINEGVGVEPGAVTTPMGEHLARPQLATPQRLPWLQATQMLGTGNPALTNPSLRAKYKSAYLRAAPPAEQIGKIYRHLTTERYDNPDALLLMASYGGRINSVRPRDTAVVQRDSVLKLLFENFWSDPGEDSYHLGWIREFYRDVYAGTGGVPVRDELTDGSYINYADADLSDPELNRSGVPWPELYYGVNYPRLQEVKRAWDPADRFRHGLSIRG